MFEKLYSIILHKNPDWIDSYKRAYWYVETSYGRYDYRQNPAPASIRQEGNPRGDPDNRDEAYEQRQWNAEEPEDLKSCIIIPDLASCEVENKVEDNRQYQP